MTKIEITDLVDRFLQWQLPDSVCSDLCVTDRDYAKRYPGLRSGTNLLTADEARQMVEYLFASHLTAASAIDGDYNAGVEAAAKLTDGEGQPMLAAEIRKLKR